MNKNSLPFRALVVIVILVAGAALAWLGLRSTKPATLPPPPTATASQEAVRVLPKVITLYQKGEGESDLAVYVAKELAAQSRGLAKFSSIDTTDEPQMLEFYGVSSVPAVIFMAPTGKIYQKHEGYLDKAAILKIVKSIK
jgi:hypothetical protein